MNMTGHIKIQWNINKMVEKVYILDKMTLDISIVIIQIDGRTFVIILEGFFWVIPNHAHTAMYGGWMWLVIQKFDENINKMVQKKNILD